MGRSQNGSRYIGGKLCDLCGRHSGPFAKENAQRERDALLKDWDLVYVVKRDSLGWDYALYVFGAKR